MSGPPGRRTGPSVNTEAGRENMAGGPNNTPQHTRSGPTIAGRVVVNARCSQTWSFADDDRVSRLVKEIVYSPGGADVTIVVAPGQFAPLALDYVREHGKHLGSLTVECSDPPTVARWVRALRDGVAVTSGHF